MKKMFGLFLVALAIFVSGLTVMDVQAQTLPNISIGEAEVVHRDGQCFVSFGFAIQNPDLVAENIIVHLYTDGQFDHMSNIGRYQVSPAEYLLVLGCPEQSAEVILDPDNLIVESIETDNQLYLDLSPEPTAISVPPTPTIPTSTATPTPTATSQCEPVFDWYTTQFDVVVSWGCQSQFHLYLNGSFSKDSVGDEVTVALESVSVSLEVVIYPDDATHKQSLFLKKEDLTQPVPTSTPEPSATPSPTPIVIPTNTPVVLPTPEVTPPSSCAVSVPTNIVVTKIDDEVTFDFGKCEVGQTHVYLNDQFVSNHVNVKMVTIHLADDVESIELVFGADDLVEPIKRRYLRWHLGIYVLLPIIEVR